MNDLWLVLRPNGLSRHSLVACALAVSLYTGEVDKARNEAKGRPFLFELPGLLIGESRNAQTP